LRTPPFGFPHLRKKIEVMDISSKLILMLRCLAGISVVILAVAIAPQTATAKGGGHGGGNAPHSKPQVVHSKQNSSVKSKANAQSRSKRSGNLVHYNRRRLWRDLGDFDRAIVDYTEEIRLDPKSAKAYAGRGEIWRLKGDLDSALADQDQAVQLEPKDGLGFLLRGDILRYKGEFNRALADYEQALRFEPDLVAAFTGIGLTYEKMGDLPRARAEFEKAVASKSKPASDINRSALETARTRLAALDSGAAQPVIPAAPSKATSATSIPTPTVSVPDATPVAAPAEGRRIALVIGNAAYKNVAPLPNPQRDAAAITGSLRAVGFQSVTLVSDATREKLIEALRTFADEAEKADWAMVYYAGHGMEVNGINYIVPVDAKLAVDRDVKFEAVPLDRMMVSVEGAKKLKLVLLDACRDNPFAPQMRKTTAPETGAARSTAGGSGGTRSIGRGLGEVKVSGATLVVYSAKHGQVALDGDGGNSPFAVAVAQRLATPGVEINKLFRLVRDDVMEATAGRQEPFTYGSLPGREDFFFVAK
jgi:tetratricopeptide (TPR) repeat protein